MEKKIAIFGCGGFGKEVLCCLIDKISNTNLKIEEVACFVVGDEYYNEEEILGVRAIRQSQFDSSLYNLIIAIGEPSKRKKVVEQLPNDTTYATAIHPNAIISKWVEIGDGSIVAASSVITCNIVIGKHAHINLFSSIGHDCIIGDYFTTSPGVNISGNCHFGDCVYFGTNSSVKQGVTICDNVTIGMGGVVVKDILEEGVYVGNPLRKLEKKYEQ